jgi:hypothetical protein
MFPESSTLKNEVLESEWEGGPESSITDKERRSGTPEAPSAKARRTGLWDLQKAEHPGTSESRKLSIKDQVKDDSG